VRSCANQDELRELTIRRDITNRISHYNEKIIDIDVLNKTIEYFECVKKNKIDKISGKWGLVGACLFYAFISESQEQDHNTICKMVRIEEKSLKKGKDHLRSLNEAGKISIPTSNRPIENCLNKYFPILEIPDSYKKFIIDIINRANIKYLNIKKENQIETKCIGAIYLLSTCVSSLNHITKVDVVNKCKISKSTFLSYYMLLVKNHKVIEKSFRRNGVPMPAEWRD
jgi:transcription initiation factor TFIIIB Brf1 subunit/transcription initiation factor TFIIB